MKFSPLTSLRSTLTLLFHMKFSIKNLIFLAVTAATLAACVPNKKVAYLQYKNEYDEPETIVKDSLLRSYETGESGYKLQAGDLLDIKISTMTPLEFNPFKDADANLIPGINSTTSGAYGQKIGYYIESDGLVNLPILGKIRLQGYGISQAEDTIESYVRKYLEKPVVKIRFLNFKFSVLGEVKEEKTLISDDNYLTMLQAVALAGGPSEFGDMSRVKVLRRFGNQTSVFYINLLDEKYLSSPFYYVQPNDVIAVSPLKQRSYLKYVSPNLAIFTATTSLLISILTLFTVF